MTTSSEAGGIAFGEHRGGCLHAKLDVPICSFNVAVIALVPNVIIGLLVTATLYRLDRPITRSVKTPNPAVPQNQIDERASQTQIGLEGSCPVTLLAKCLQSAEGVETVISAGWPEDPKSLEGAKRIVVYSSPAAEFLLDGPGSS